MCLPAPEVKDVSKEAKEDFGHSEIVMEDVTAQPDASEEQQIVVSENQQSTRTSSGVISKVLLKIITNMQVENALIKERLDRQEMLFQLTLSRLLPPPPQNP